MSKVKYVKYEENLCFKCLKKKEAINTYELKNRGYGSIYDNDDTKLQLCNECVGSIENNNELEKWFNEKPTIVDRTEEYQYENNIKQYIETLPIQGREIFENQLSNSWIEDSQVWIDRELGLIEEDVETEINDNIESIECTYENLKLNKNDVIVIKYPWSDEYGCMIDMDHMILLQKKFQEVFEGYEILMIPDSIKISIISKEEEDI